MSFEQALAELHDNPLGAARLIIKEAAHGDCEAQVLLGQILLDGRGIQQDAQLALKWFCIAAARGHGMANNMAGRCLEHGWGCPADPAEAAGYYQRAANLGLDWGLYNLANLVATGRGVKQDPLQAFKLYQRAAQMGHAKSMNLVGRYFEEGQVVPRDITVAYDWYRCSAEAGDFRGQFSHACVLMDQGRWDEARHWLQQALVLGHLKFLRKARDELLAAALAPIQDITAAYVSRCEALESSTTRPQDMS
nr:tetratricopeptide repeat protein [Azomonas macrocytogenes]